LIISIRRELDDVADPDIYDAQKSLVLFLEFLLIEHLYGEDAVLIHSEVEALVPVGVQCPFGHYRRLGLLTVDRGNSKGIREAKDITLAEPVGSNDCHSKVWWAGRREPGVHPGAGHDDLAGGCRSLQSRI